MSIGIDLGTANCLVCVKDKGIVLREPSVVTYDEKQDEVIAVGTEAKRMIGRTPKGLRTVRPLCDGVIADFGLTLAMMKLFVRRAMHTSLFSRPQIIVCIPYGVTDVEKRAVQNAAAEVGASGVSLIAEPVAAAIGAGLPFRACKGHMIVDIGGGTTEVAVVTGGGLAVSRSLRIAGDACDRAVSEYIRQKFNVIVGDNTAEEIKREIGTVHEGKPTRFIEVRGRHIATGLPSSFDLYAEETAQALSEPVGRIIDVIRATLEVTPPELCADMLETGITLSGGGALLDGLPELIAERTSLPVRVAQKPLDCVAAGMLKVMASPEAYKGILIS